MKHWLAVATIGFLAAMSGFGFAVVLVNDQSPAAGRPILWSVGCLLAATAFSLWAIAICCRSAVSDRKLTIFIIAVAAVVRLGLLWTWPFQEIDAYRYVWDGNVVTCGISPYRYSPHAVSEAARKHGQRDDESGKRPFSQDTSLDDREMMALVELSPPGSSLAEIRRRIHFEQLRTIYPPVAQAVYALAAWSTPRNASPYFHLVVMKVWITAFDFGTFLLIIRLLRIANRHVGWSIAYGWSPLVLKEFANTGHLDSIAIFFCVTAVYFVSRMDAASGKKFRPLCSAVCLALAVAAKLFPVILAPVIASAVARHRGWKSATVFGVVSIGLAGMMLLPMAPTTDTENHVENDGLIQFVSRFRINDLVFSFVQENLESPRLDRPPRPVWFVVIPVDQRAKIEPFVEKKIRPLAKQLGIVIPSKSASFIVTRVFTLLLFSLIAVILIRRKRATATANDFLNTAFLTLAAFWFLLPTQNPWYWCWAMPLICFSKNRWWMVTAGFALIYYLRFWFKYDLADVDVLGSGYVGVNFFDFVVVWLEHGIVLAGLLVTMIWRRVYPFYPFTAIQTKTATPSGIR